MNEKSGKNSWSEKQSQAAEASGLAVVARDEKGALLAATNYNSMCRALYGSNEFAPACEAFCGKAFEWAREAGRTVAYRCYAGLDCRAVPVSIDDKTEFVAIVGRAFTRAEDYRRATLRAIDGDWRRFAPTEFFSNVLLTGAGENLDAAARDFETATDEEKRALLELAAPLAAAENAPDEREEARAESETENAKSETAKAENAETKIAEIENAKTLTAENAATGEAQTSDETAQTNEAIEADETPQIIEAQQPEEARQVAEVPPIIEQTRGGAAPQTAVISASIAAQTDNNGARESDEAAAWRSLFGALLESSYEKACAAILEFLSERYSLKSLAWLERRGERLEIVLAGGSLGDREIEFDISADDERLREAARAQGALELRERDAAAENQTVWLFPVAVGGAVRSALVAGEVSGGANKKIRRRLARFCRAVAPELEILRLQEELRKRGWIERAVRRFNENLRRIDAEDFWQGVVEMSAELLRAERCSLLVFDEKSGAFRAKAAIGATADAVKAERETLGFRVAARVLENGSPVVVADVERVGLERAPADWKYKSKSFIGFPIEIGARKIGVLNFTERADGDRYEAMDLDLLRAIVPQLAVLIDRAALKDKAGEYEQLSVTDALTGLLNRRYLEERLAEEALRSNRYGFPMSFLMIDVDEFKSYNDRFSHPEGDKALKLVAQHLKETLRGADIAARYGGEEFSILLPQTTAGEAAVIAERVRASVDAAEFPNRKVTVSIGVATCSQTVCTPQEIVRAADNALYEAKRAGRNNVQIYATEN